MEKESMESMGQYKCVHPEIAAELIKRGHKAQKDERTWDDLVRPCPVWVFELDAEVMEVVNNYYKSRGKELPFYIEAQLEKAGLLQKGIEVRG